MSLQHDLHGLPLTTTSEDAAKAFGRTVLAYLRGRLNALEWLNATLAADPGFSLAHCLKGYFTMLAQRRSLLDVAADAHRAAARLGALDTARERAHVAALGSWSGGDVEAALKIWKQIIDKHPTDVLALRLAQFNDFWLGRAHHMLATVASARTHWHDDLTADGLVQSLHAFALNECGHFVEAEREARGAVERDPLDLWGVHACGQALQSQGRSTAAIDWIEAAEPSFEGANQLIHHLDWHRALAHLRCRDFDRVLELYDDRVRKLRSPLVAAQPGFFLDIINAASLLWYLRCEGIAVGGRWEELADQAEAWNDTLSAFLLPHRMMALAATGRRGKPDARGVAQRADRPCDTAPSDARRGSARLRGDMVARRGSTLAGGDVHGSVAGSASGVGWQHAATSCPGYFAAAG